MKDKQQIWIEKWHITRLKSVFPRTQSRELLTAELYKNLQRAVSPSEKYFLGNKNLFERNNPSHNREIYDLFLSYVEVDPEQLPERFIELFELKGDKEEIKKQTLSLFKQARLLDKKSETCSRNSGTRLWNKGYYFPEKNLRYDWGNLKCNQC